MHPSGELFLHFFGYIYFNIYNFKGYSFDDKIEDNKYTYTITYNYKVMDMKKLIEN